MSSETPELPLSAPNATRVAETIKDRDDTARDPRAERKPASAPEPCSRVRSRRTRVLVEDVSGWARGGCLMSYVRIKPDVLDALSTEERLAEWERLMTEIALVAGEVLFDGAEGAGAHLREVRLRLDVNLGEAS